MGEVITVGLGIAKHVFQVHGVGENGEATIRRKLGRSDVLMFFGQLPPCLVGIEACAPGHHWARELIALGHDVRLMPASYVMPYVKPQKNDAADAEAICEAFNGRFRDVCLNENVFRDLGHARHLIAEWVRDYNHRRPHSALGYLTPNAYAAALRPQRDDAPELRDGSARHPIANTAHMSKMQPPTLDHAGQ